MTNAQLLSNGNTLAAPTTLAIPGPDNFTPGVIVPQNPDGSSFIKIPPRRSSAGPVR